MRERVRHCEARALALREGRRSNPLAMKSIKQDTCALNYGTQQRAMFLLSITLIACTPHRSRAVVRGLLRPSARSQRDARNDGIRGYGGLVRLRRMACAIPARVRHCEARALDCARGAEAIPLQ
jgi:hypothetical protein